MESSTLLSTLGWTGSSDEIAKLIHPLRGKLLSLHSCRILLLQQVGVTVVLPLCIANGGGCCMQECCCGGGGNVLAEGAEEWRSVMGVCGKGSHQLRFIFCELEARVDFFLLLCGMWSLVLAACAATGATRLVWQKSK